MEKKESQFGLRFGFRQFRTVRREKIKTNLFIKKFYLVVWKVNKVWVLLWKSFGLHGKNKQIKVFMNSPDWMEAE